ncbi:MAG: anti-sigma factor antagonist [Phycisphaerales bacterium]|nr:anti-sigma factor antagonist [Phycisphaerales bacterium]
MATISEIKATDGSTVLRLAGGLTYDGVTAVARPLDAAVAAGGTVVVSLADVSIVTTPGISLLLSAHQRLAHAGGQLVLSAVPPNLRDLLRRCRLDRVFTFAPGDAVPTG